MAVILQVKVKPRAKVSELAQAPDGTWTAKMKAPPVEGNAKRRTHCPGGRAFPLSNFGKEGIVANIDKKLFSNPDLN